MRAHYLQHEPFEGLANIEPWLKNAGYEIHGSHLFAANTLPAPESMDLLVIMGGSMSVNNEIEFPWLVSEKQFIRDVIHLGTPVLGICLGAQLIASAMGASIYKNPVKEIGWFPIQGITSDNPSLFKFPLLSQVFHWHGETFALPQGATRLAKSAACENQAFQLGDTVIGLQFHLETTFESAQSLTSHCRNELIASQYIQTEQEILSTASQHYQSIAQLLNNVLSFLQQSR